MTEPHTTPDDTAILAAEERKLEAARAWIMKCAAHLCEVKLPTDYEADRIYRAAKAYIADHHAACAKGCTR